MSKDNIIDDLFLKLRESEKFCFLTRSEEFQKQSMEDLNSIKYRITEAKEKAIIDRDEINANRLLSSELIIDALVSELSMWIELKKENYDNAWDLLVNAQSYLQKGYQASNDVGFNFDGYSYKLSLIEKIIFPNPMFVSPGMIVESAKCSICGKNYGECDHLVGRPYMGKLCYQIIDKIKEIREVSIVEEPANKHARVKTFTVNDIKRDTLTWKEIKEEDKQQD